MVRLMLVLAPVMCILSGIGVSSTLNTYMKNLDVSRKDKKTSKKNVDHTYPFKNEVCSANEVNTCCEENTFYINLNLSVWIEIIVIIIMLGIHIRIHVHV